MSRHVSPNELQRDAINMMLHGRKPVSRHDWGLCANFWAANIKSGFEVPATVLLGKIFDCPLTERELVLIAEFQAKRKA